jgi:hypothetical protein
MTNKITRWAFRLLVCLVVTGCSSFPVVKKPVAEDVGGRSSAPVTTMPNTEEADLFAQGLDQYLETGELTALTLFPQEYPAGEWRTRAEGIIEMAKKQHQQHDQLQQKDKDLAQCHTDMGALAENNKSLEITLEQLKQVLIDMELHAK